MIGERPKTTTQYVYPAGCTNKGCGYSGLCDFEWRWLKSSNGSYRWTLKLICPGCKGVAQSIAPNQEMNYVRVAPPKPKGRPKSP